MIGSIAALLILQLIGTIVIRLTGLPLPGPVVGMLLLFACLLWRGATPEPLAATTRGLLANLGLLFVPAGVGVITHLAAVADHWIALSVTLVGSALISIVVTAFTLSWLMRHARVADAPPSER
ncbi:CidA/LrgA family protein [Salinisphaera sp. T31B1]|uniref:CidA/LrgA family protein n=1 Tax=Salinisphaera sp. T31B1 TaxID=727963 RepID=UPI0033400D27